MCICELFMSVSIIQQSVIQQLSSCRRQMVCDRRSKVVVSANGM
jgi:hypothetical protein